LFCDASCHRITCDPAPGLCGNGTIDPGEACEPPGVGDCGPTCQLASCDPPASGEIALACVALPFPQGAATTVAAGATPSGYLVGWNGQHQRARGEVLVERLDADGNRVDAGLTVATDGTPCAAEPGGMSIGADGSGYYTMWNAGGLLSDGFPGFQAIYGRRVGGTTG